jgi:phosphoribosylglycinamide formyltransferase-1
MTEAKPARLGILLSGRGSNFLAIAEAIGGGKLNGAEIAVVISNIAEAPGLERAQAMGLATALFVSKGRKRAEHDADVTTCLREHGVDLVILAGYMRLLSPEFTNAFRDRILNIHPSLLPAFPGWTRRSKPSTTAARLRDARSTLSTKSWITA